MAGFASSSVGGASRRNLPRVLAGFQACGPPLTFFSNSTNASAEVSSGTPATPEVKRSATLGAPRPDEKKHHRHRHRRAEQLIKTMAAQAVGCKRRGGLHAYKRVLFVVVFIERLVRSTARLVRQRPLSAGSLK